MFELKGRGSRSNEETLPLGELDNGKNATLDQESRFPQHKSASVILLNNPGLR
jgi:hypothetical protein